MSYPTGYKRHVLLEVKPLQSKVSSKLVEMFIESFLLLLALNFLSAGRLNRPEERIIGGYPVEIETFPWSVSFQINGQHSCGGSIYSNDTIITAAHCFFDKGRRLDDRLFVIRAGSTSRKSSGTLVKVDSVILHENFVFKFLQNDIAVVRLSERLEFTNQVQPIPLAETNPEPGTMSLAAGWGQIYETEDLVVRPINILGVKLRIQPPNHCIVSYGQSTICAGNSKQSTCRGDSGGALVIDSQLVGVVSGGEEYCDSATFFTSVPFFREWILNTTNSIS